MSSQNAIEKIATVLVTACAVVVTGLVVRRELFTSQPRPAHFEVSRLPNWRQYATAGHSMGPTQAPVTIVEFGDFECPACLLLHQSMDSLAKLHPGAFRVVFRHYPLSIHRFAISAARASECANADNRFQQMHDALFAYRDSLGLVEWSWFAVRAGISDTTEFVKCVRSHAPIPALARDTADARRLRIKGTPLVLMNGLLFFGAPPFDTLAALLDRAEHETGHD